VPMAESELAIDEGRGGADSAMPPAPRADPFVRDDGSASKSITRGVSSADLSVMLSDFPDPVARGALLIYSIGVQNAGPNAAADARLATSIPAGTTFRSIIVPPGSTWSCSTPSVGATGSIDCTTDSLVVGGSSLSFFVRADTDIPAGTLLTQSITASSSTADPDDIDRTASTSTRVVGPGTTLSARKSASGQFRPGGVVTYRIVVNNDGPAYQPDLDRDEVFDVLPAGLTLQSASATSGTAIANLGTNTVTWNGSLTTAGTVTITIRALIAGNLAAGTRLENQAQLFFDANGDGFVETIATSDDPNTAASGDATAIVLQGVAAPVPAVVPASFTWTLVLLAALLSLVAGNVIRRRA
jgi:uncharacterized repeat protein (TIGR01451 family)